MTIVNGSMVEAYWYDHSLVEDSTGNMLVVEAICVHMVVATCKHMQAVEGTYPEKVEVATCKRIPAVEGT